MADASNDLWEASHGFPSQPGSGQNPAHPGPLPIVPNQKALCAVAASPAQYPGPVKKSNSIEMYLTMSLGVRKQNLAINMVVRCCETPLAGLLENTLSELESRADSYTIKGVKTFLMASKYFSGELGTLLSTQERF